MTESVLDRKFFGRLTSEQTLYLVMAIAAVVLRTYALGVRPLHHDESIHADFSWKIVESGIQSYRYDPVYHGPLLYYSSALVMWLFGDSDFTSRLSAVLFGFGLLAFAWPLRRYLGRWGALSFFALTTFSPAWTYFTRFVRHDIYLALCNFAAVYLIFRYGETRRAAHLYGSAAALALGFATKEDNYLTTPLLLLCFAGMLIWEVMAAEDRRVARAAVLGESKQFLRDAARPLLPCALIFLALWIVFYTSLFQNPEYGWDKIRQNPLIWIYKPIKDALTYWMGQQQIRRIGGPWWYYLPQLALYDPLILFPLAALLARPLLERPGGSPLGRHAASAALIASIAFFVVWLSRSPFAPLVLLFAVAAALLALATFWQPSRFVRFLLLWSVGSLAVYAWAQEKVPWLLVPQLLPLTVLAASWFGERLEQSTRLRPAALVPAALGGLLTLWTLFSANFVWDAPKPDEPGASLKPPVRHAEMLAYVQSTYHVNKLVKQIEELGQALGTGTNTRLAISGDATWPLSWYMRHYPVNWGLNPRRVDTPVLIVDKKPDLNKAYDTALAATHDRVDFQIRGWWTWESRFPSLNELVRFLVFREAWRVGKDNPEPMGSSDAVMYVLRNPAPGMQIPAIDTNPPPPPVGYTKSPEVIVPAAAWGRRGSGPGELNEPRGIALDAAGNLYVVDTRNQRIQKLGPNGEVLLVFGSEGGELGQLKDPCGVAVGRDGSIYVADTWNHRIQKFDAGGKPLLQWAASDPGFWGPRGIAVAPDGTVFVTDTGNKRVLAYSAEGTLVTTWGAEGSEPGQFIEPVGIAIDAAGNVVVADTGNHRVQLFRPDGTPLRQFQVAGWEEFHTEPYLAAHGTDIYVTDSFNHRIARYRNDKLDAVWGRSGTGEGSFNRPIGIAVDPSGAIYVSDTFNHRIQKFPPQP